MKLIGLDTNFLAYLAGVGRSVDDDRKINAARALMTELNGKVGFVVSAQALGDLFVVLNRSGASREEAQVIVATFSDDLDRVGTTPELLDKALDLAVLHKLQMWDAIIVTASMAAGCTLLLSEDMQHGFRAGPMTIVNPFIEPLHAALSSIKK